ncbi:hypothetical protein FBQ85_24220 [Cytophagia bacterium CHB2]|nr:hypothetical protein [Cytophagia bacterium CHB2]
MQRRTFLSDARRFRPFHAGFRFNNHGYHYSIEGERKRDWPPSQFYHHTWWKHYGQFTDYAARLSHILSGGRHVAKVRVLYLLSSIWANCVPQNAPTLATCLNLISII